jgi:hypothetical protein
MHPWVYFLVDEGYGEDFMLLSIEFGMYAIQRDVFSIARMLEDFGALNGHVLIEE